MIERAAHLARLFPAAFVVMGHTHTPAKIAINDGEATYINVGSWAEEEGDDGEPADTIYRAARTHLVSTAATMVPSPNFSRGMGAVPDASAPRSLCTAGACLGVELSRARRAP
jgi:hypothetical protein